MITASSIDRVTACPLSETLPHVHRSSDLAHAGNVRHWYLEEVGRVGRRDALAQIDDEEERAMCEVIDLDGLPVNCAAEVAFAWDSATGKAREIGRGIKRDYSSCSSTEVAGTSDVVGISEDELYIGDYKGFEFVRARGNRQLLFGALCASKVYGRDASTLEIINIRGSENFRNKAHVDFFDLVEFESELVSTVLVVEKIRAGAESEPVEGPHCKYCPAFDACPAKILLLSKMLTTNPAELRMITPENATEAYRNYKLMREMMKSVTAAIHGYAAHAPIDIGGGKVFGARDKIGNEELDGDIVYEVVKELHGQEAADTAVSRRATKKGIEKAVREAKTGFTLKAGKEAVLAGVRSRGGVTQKIKTTIDEHRAKE